MELSSLVFSDLIDKVQGVRCEKVMHRDINFSILSLTSNDLLVIFLIIVKIDIDVSVVYFLSIF
ncbi:hypothetical protein AQ824_11275 [Burkholderia pseudomallei]|nr:hypothetical protein SZ29_04940 [Burkholderia pseudomallei]KNA31940.1 hypothetical protein ADU20_21525 [Burkholderia pseudomallei]OMR79024.1 hypothetical protein AQ730_32005 [Burkholderia pseudomallei]OMS87890.1 hypothetical protein AQ748_10405 [Burkholderia pseudomallei]OMU96655.1 hypothetical protein AQ784_11345 [Burkholderia pseudomallei]